MAHAYFRNCNRFTLEDTSAQSKPVDELQSAISPSTARITPTNRVEAIRSRAAANGFPGDVVNILLDAIRPNSSPVSTYQLVSLVHGTTSRTMCGSLVDVLRYLAFLSWKGPAYNSMNVRPSMLSVTLEPVNNVEIGKAIYALQWGFTIALQLVQ